MRKSVCSAALPASAYAGSLQLGPPVPRLYVPDLRYAWPTRLVHGLAAWLVCRYGQPPMSSEDAYLALSADHADCERRQRILDRQHARAWRLLP